MRYAIINKALGENNGFKPVLHLIIDDNKMVVNENELRLVDEDINHAAETLGGKVYDYSEIQNIINRK